MGNDRKETFYSVRDGETADEYSARIKYVADVIDGTVRVALVAANLDPSSRAHKGKPQFDSYSLRSAIAMAVGLINDPNPEFVDMMGKVVRDCDIGETSEAN